MTDAAARNVSDLLQQAERLIASHDETASGSPVMALARQIGRQMGCGALPMDQVEDIVRLLRDRAFAGRAHHIATYLDGPDETAV
uniref:hypothetical protein n=1 Tax=Komagataeibacter kakiaceti TaxID=943261 RepID=UPI0005519445